jgi:hypothetical protein
MGKRPIRRHLKGINPVYGAGLELQWCMPKLVAQVTKKKGKK